ncbi:Bardet-Biedl syndrome 10 protein isoform X3 [Gopherus flavomarginatus]|uniref:Bardet-Biedl syndrome 10 protein isoform X3 n=1 Tax=Gopherus flavomarginatus TaxID=286002 RepID=UPI0021CBA47D|nr:Bardet-Biedl syndrome 10 protein isoform X3 [Gopherus flavomarginatus]
MASQRLRTQRRAASMASAASLDLGRLVQEAEALASAVRGALGPRGGQVLVTRPTGETLLTRDGRRVLEALNLGPPTARILEGLVLHRDFAVYCPADGDIRMLIITESIDSALSPSGLEFVVNAEVQYQASQVWITKRTEAIMKHLQNSNIKVLLSSVKQQEIVIYYAKISGISIVECLSSEEISLLCRATGISPFIPTQDNIRSEISETMTAKFCRPLVLGSKRYVHLGLTRTGAFEPHCVIFCGPVRGVTEQHASAFHGAFKMLQQLFKAVDLSDGCEAQPENTNNTSKTVHCSWQQSATQQKFIMDNISCNREKVNDQQLKTSMVETEKHFIDSSSWVDENPSCNQTDLQKSSDLAMPLVKLESDFMFSALIDRGSSVRELQKPPLKCKHPSEMWVMNNSKPLVNNHRICNDAMTAIENTSISVVSKQLDAAQEYWKPGNPIVPFKYEKSYKHTVQSYTNLVMQAGSVLPVGGNFEILLHYYLHSYAKQCQQPKISLISTVIADALLSIPKILYRTTKENSFTQVYFKATSALQTNQQLPMHQQGLESVYCKYQLVASVLHCLTKLLTIDLIIGIKRPPQKTEVNDSEDDL